MKKDVLYLVFRIMVGMLFFFHGAQKFGLIGDGSLSGFAGAFSFPLWLAFIVAFIEMVGGILIAIGLFTRVAALGSAIVMVAAYFIAHIPKGIYPLANGGELALLYLAAFLVVIAYGRGKYCVGKKLFKNRWCH